MTPDRLRQIEDLYHEAREASAQARAALLARADPELRGEVESLLACQEESLPTLDPLTVTELHSDVRLGPYQVESKIGEGGMGEVFRAVDTRLGRAVAIKVVDQRFTERFEREARAISSLNHPNICTLYDIGPNYFVMELVEGETIAARLKSGPLPIKTSLSYASQIMAALVEAHGKGIVHRDLKPANIMIAKSGIKVLDFGLAKSGHDETITASRMMMGTPAYMSPEQREGKPADARSDIYSFGCVLHEMLTGVRPSSQRKQMPSRRLEKIVSRCLEEDPARRWQSATELERELATVTATRPWTSVSHATAALVLLAVAALIGVAIYAWRQRAASVEIHSLAILGLENRSGDGSQDYFADGLSNALAANLGRLNGVRVISPAASLAYRGTKKPLPEIGKELNADLLLDGTVSRAANRVEITARLVNARSGRDLWSHTYDSSPADLPSAQNQIERDIAAQLHASAPDRARLIDTRKLDPRAYDLSLQGSYHLWRITAPDADQAIALYEQAVAIAPDFAPLQANLASAYAEKSFDFAPDDQQLEGHAFAAIEKAFALDPNSAEAHLARGLLLWRQSHGFPHRAALAEFRLAAAAQPNLEAAWWNIAGVLIHVGHLDDALVELHKAAAINPSESRAFSRIMEVYLFQGKPQLSIDERSRTPPRVTIPIMDFDHTWALIDLGRFEEAARTIRAGFADSNPGAAGLKHGVSALLAARQGNRPAAESEIRAALAGPHGFGHFHHVTFMIACAYSVLGDTAHAQEWMEKTAADGFPCFSMFEVEPSLERWRATPKGHEFLAGLRREWEATP
jgi:TolB-like protein/tRNA A-37 threonylcarbamoyl transferase component Bud32/tetratricopeptide (TPR) repeat protein